MKKSLFVKSVSLLMTLIMVLGMAPIFTSAVEAETETGELPVITLDFDADSKKGKSVSAFTVEEDGWAYNTQASHDMSAIFYRYASGDASTHWDYTSLRFTLTDYHGAAVLDFNAPEAGKYSMELTYCYGGPGHYTDVTIGDSVTQYFGWSPWGTAPGTVINHGVELQKGINQISFAIREDIETNYAYIMLKKIVFTKVPEPHSGLVIDLQAAANDSAELSTYGVTGPNVPQNGWGIDLDETAPGKNAVQTFKYYAVKGGTSQTPKFEDGTIPGVYFSATESSIGITINFNVPEDGYYRPDVSSICNLRCGKAAFWVDGQFVGTYAGYGPDAPVITKHEMNTVYLTKGIHKVQFKCIAPSDRFSNYSWLYLSGIEFVPVDGAQQVYQIELHTKKDQFYLGDRIAYEVIPVDDQGKQIHLGAHKDGAENWSIVSSDPETLKIEDGRLCALKVGTVDVTVTIALPECTKTYTRTITVEKEPQPYDFEICFDEDARQGRSPSQFTLEDDGWRFAAGKGAWFSSWADEIKTHGKYMGLVNKQMIDHDQSQWLAIDVKAPATGDFRIDLCNIFMGVCGEVKVYFDGEYIGTYNGKGTVNWELGDVTLTNVHMQRNQVYRLTFAGQIPLGSDNVYVFLNKIKFVVDDTPEQPVNDIILSMNRTTMAVGEDCAYTFTAFDENKQRLPIDQPLEGFTSRFMFVSVSDPSVIKVEGDTIYALKPGKSDITVTVTSGGQTRSVTKSIEINTDVLSNVNFYLEADHLVAGETAQTGFAASTNSGRELDHKHLQIDYASADEAVATIDENGLVTAVGEGKTQLTVTVTMAGVSVSASVPMTVTPKTGKIFISNPEGVMSVHPDDEDGIELLVTGVDAEGNELDLTGADVSFEIETDGVIKIENGRALPIALGNTTVLVIVTMPDGVSYETTTWISVNGGKTEPTYFTWDKRNAAVYNAKKYSWAHDMATSATQKADYVVEHLDEFYDIIPFEGIPRADNLGMKEDPLLDYCPICGVDTLGQYGHYSWITDPINEPWKVRCPACKSAFPSNDFESYYKSGLDARGVFHAENADTKYLVNELYPEKGAGWCVDAGWGWDTGETYTNRNGTQSPRIYAFAGYFNANGLWNGFYSNSTNNVRMAIRSLTDAYLYTGDIKYGRAGAILIDRIADIYPTMSLTDVVYEKPRSNIASQTASSLKWGRAYSNNEGMCAQGKLLGNISEGNFLAKDFIKAYDAFYPAFDDWYVVNYLAARAEEQGLVVNGENPKDTPQELRQNGIDGILHEVSEGVRNRDILGNFGMAQSSMALAAVVLDSTEYFSDPVDEPLNMPTGERRKMNSNEMIAWLFEVGPHSQNYMFNKIIKAISRDGHGDEVSPNYHQAWMSNLIEFADAMEGYEGYPSADLYQNPKFIKMLVGNLALTAGGNTTLQNGDSGSAGGISIYMDKGTIARAFRVTGNVELAQALYFLNGETTKGLVGNIFDPDADHLGTKVQAVIDEYGPYDVNKSVLLPGYGQALLKWGNKYDDDQGLYGLWFGRIAGAHGNRNALDLNIFAYDINMAPSLGYPRAANSDLIRSVWERGTISRNTVIIDDSSQINFSYLNQYTNSDPYHFDDAGRVKVMDAEGAEAYGDLADEYRRTIVAVQGDDDAYYAVDFFHVIGGSTHLYSFHAASLKYPASDSVQTVKQEGGTYAGADVPYGSDNANGYAFLYDVETDRDPENSFYLDYSIYDHNHILVDGSGLHLRLNMLSTEDEPFTEVTFAKGHPPIKAANPDYYPYSLIRKDGSDSLFTAVYEPYRHNRYLKSMELVEVEVIEGQLYADDRASAVKVYREDGKVEYIVYCTNYDAVLRVDDRFEFSGFVGVVTYESTEPNANICYRYGMDASIVAGPLQENKAITGKVVDFTRELSYENFISVTLDQDIDPETLVGRVIYVENDGEENAAYIIKGVSVDGENVILDLDDQHLVRSLKEPANVLGGYYCNIAVGQSYRIPMSVSEDVTAVISYVPAQVIRAGNKMSVTVGVENSGCTYASDDLVSGMKLDTRTGTLTWTTSRAKTGRFPVTVKAVRDGEYVAEMTFVLYVVNYAGGTYSPESCTHSKALTYEADGVTETVCPACGTVTKTPIAPECGHTETTSETVSNGDKTHTSTVTCECGEVISTETVACTDADKDCDCDVCGATIKEIKKAVFAGSNMTLGNELEVNFLMVKKNLPSGIDYTATITQKMADGTERVTEIAMADWGAMGSTYHKISARIAAREMADDLYIEIKDAEGYVYNEEYFTSVRGYAGRALAASSTTDYVRVMMIDMLNYGAAAQNHFKYNVEDLANNELTEAQQALATAKVTCTNKQVKDATVYGANLSLEDSILLNTFFKGLKSKDVTTMYAMVNFTDFEGKAKEVRMEGTEFEKYGSSGDIYKIVVDDVVLADAKTLVTVTLYNADGSVHGTGTDSVESYVARAESNNADTYGLYANIMKFATSAYNYIINK